VDTRAKALADECVVGTLNISTLAFNSSQGIGHNLTSFVGIRFESGFPLDCRRHRGGVCRSARGGDVEENDISWGVNCRSGRTPRVYTPGGVMMDVNAPTGTGERNLTSRCRERTGGTL